MVSLYIYRAEFTPVAQMDELSETAMWEYNKATYLGLS